ASVQITADPGALPAGTYQGTITFTAPDAKPSVRTIAVKFTVSPARPAKIAVRPEGLSFPLVERAPAATQTITVSNQGGGSLDFAATATAVSGGNWLSVTPASGT